MDPKFKSKVEEKFVKRDVDVKPGDRVKVHIRIEEAGKERIQIFEGIVLSVKGSGLSRTFTVRKISHGIGVEKIFPVQSPLIKKIDVVERGKKVRRSKLYYMRKRIGKRSLDVELDEQFEAVMGMDEEEFEEMRKAAEGEDEENEKDADEVEAGDKEESKDKSKDAEKEGKEEKQDKMTEEKVDEAQEEKKDSDVGDAEADSEADADAEAKDTKAKDTDKSESEDAEDKE
jgi:large subunit ribosomal protein L19